MAIPLRQVMALLGRYLANQRLRVVGLGLLTIAGIGLQLLPFQIIGLNFEGAKIKSVTMRKNENGRSQFVVTLSPVTYHL